MAYKDIPGPQGKGERFLKKLAELLARGFNPIRARRIASGVNNKKKGK